MKISAPGGVSGLPDPATRKSQNGERLTAYLEDARGALSGNTVRAVRADLETVRGVVRRAGALSAARERRAALHRARYGGGDRADARGTAEGLATLPGGRPEPFSRYQRRKLGDDALVVEEHRAPDRDTGEGEPAGRGGPLNVGRDRGDDSGRDAARERGGSVRGGEVRHTGESTLDRARSACREAIERVRDLYDRFGTPVDGGIGGVVRAVRDGTAAAIRAGRSLAAAGRSLAAASRAAQRTGDALDRGLRDARREAAQTLEMMRQRGPERDQGPTR